MSKTRNRSNEIPYIPPSVKKTDMNDGALIPMRHVDKIILAVNSINGGKDGRYTANRINDELEDLDINFEAPYSIIKNGGTYYAVYQSYIPDEPENEFDSEIEHEYEPSLSDDEEDISDEYMFGSQYDEDDSDIIEEIEIIEEFESLEEEIFSGDEDYDTEESYEGDSLTMDANSGFGSVAIGQNIQTLDWVAVKSVRESNDVIDIFHEITEESDLETGETLVITETRETDITPHNELVDIEKRGLKKAGQLLGHVQIINEQDKMQDEIIMKLAPGAEIAEYILGREMPAIKWVDLAISVINTALQIQRKGLLHRDYKPENLFYDAASGIVTPIDFGMAVEADRNGRFISEIFEGTPDFAAPELSPYEEQDRYVYSEKTEVYALAATLAEVFGIKDMVVSKDEISYDATEFEQRITNPTAREEIINSITKAMSPQPKDRQGISNILQELKHIRGQHLDLQSKIVKLAYINVDEFKSLGESEKSELIAALRAADEVQLYAGRSTDSDWSHIKHELESQGISVLDTVVLPGKGMMNVLNSNTTKLEKESDVIYNAFYVASPSRKEQKSFGNVTVVIADPVAREKSGKDIHYYPRLIKASIDSVVLRDGHYEKAFSNVSNQVKLLREHDYDNPHIEQMERFLQTLKKTGPKTTYKDLFDGLEKLEAAMRRSQIAMPPKPTRQPSAAKSRSGFFTPDPLKAVTKVREEIEKEVGIRKSGKK